MGVQHKSNVCDDVAMYDIRMMCASSGQRRYDVRSHPPPSWKVQEF